MDPKKKPGPIRPNIGQRRMMHGAGGGVLEVGYGPPGTFATHQRFVGGTSSFYLISGPNCAHGTWWNLKNKRCAK